MLQFIVQNHPADLAARLFDLGGFGLIHPVDRRIVRHLAWFHESGIKLLPGAVVAFTRGDVFSRFRQYNDREFAAFPAGPGGAELHEALVAQEAQIFAHLRGVALVEIPAQVINRHSPEAADLAHGFELGRADLVGVTTLRNGAHGRGITQAPSLPAALPGLGAACPD